MSTSFTNTIKSTLRATAPAFVSRIHTYHLYYADFYPKYPTTMSNLVLIARRRYAADPTYSTIPSKLRAIAPIFVMPSSPSVFTSSKITATLKATAVPTVLSKVSSEGTQPTVGSALCAKAHVCVSPLASSAVRHMTNNPTDPLGRETSRHHHQAQSS
jgi:hypothetical protein